MWSTQMTTQTQHTFYNIRLCIFFSTISHDDTRAKGKDGHTVKIKGARKALFSKNNTQKKSDTKFTLFYVFNTKRKLNGIRDDVH